jgi:hypothetical protein
MMGVRKMYREHLEALADECAVDLELFDPTPGMEYRARLIRSTYQPPRVLAPTPINRQRYLAGLHEFGHLETAGTLGWWGTTADETPTGEGLQGSCWLTCGPLTTRRSHLRHAMPGPCSTCCITRRLNGCTDRKGAPSNATQSHRAGYEAHPERGHRIRAQVQRERPAQIT